MFFIRTMNIFFVCAFSMFAFGKPEISVNAFVSKNTSFYPEVNIVIFNNGNQKEYLDILFSPIKSDKASCKIEADDAQTSFKKYMMRSFFSDFGQPFNTSATIFPREFSHRFIVFGSEDFTYPCSLFYTVKNKENQVMASGSIEVNNTPNRLSFDVPKEENIDIMHTVEAVYSESPAENKALITLLIKNRSNNIFNFYISRKRLIGCTKTAFDKNILQGMDGSNMATEPMSYSAALILLSLGSERSHACQLEVQVEDVHRRFLKVVKIPIKPVGEYRDLSPADPVP